MLHIHVPSPHDLMTWCLSIGKLLRTEKPSQERRTVERTREERMTISETKKKVYVCSDKKE
jgi:hypothetical protein